MSHNNRITIDRAILIIKECRLIEIHEGSIDITFRSIGEFNKYRETFIDLPISNAIFTQKDYFPCIRLYGLQHWSEAGRTGAWFQYRSTFIFQVLDVTTLCIYISNRRGQ